jgi:hypothetical protein
MGLLHRNDQLWRGLVRVKGGRGIDAPGVSLVNQLAAELVAPPRFSESFLA